MSNVIIPKYPGETLKTKFMEPRCLTITELAKGIGITRSNLSLVINNHTGISPDLAIKLSQAFNTTAEYWTDLQTKLNYILRKRKLTGERLDALIK